jgi:uncharacterized membrane protein
MDLNNTLMTTVTPYSQIGTLFGISLLTIIIIAFLIVLIKGFALWRAAQNKSKGWFWVLMFVNTLGILDLLYLLIFSRRRR